MQARVAQCWRSASPCSARYCVSPEVSRFSALAINAASRRSWALKSARENRTGASLGGAGSGAGVAVGAGGCAGSAAVGVADAGRDSVSGLVSTTRAGGAVAPGVASAVFGRGEQPAASKIRTDTTTQADPRIRPPPRKTVVFHDQPRNGAVKGSVSAHLGEHRRCGGGGGLLDQPFAEGLQAPLRRGP